MAGKFYEELQVGDEFVHLPAEKRESKTKTDRGIVTFEPTATNQHNDIDCLCIRTGMMARRN